MSIEARGITRRFGAEVALDDVSLSVPTGELVALLGPSGSGKTTLLRVIAGLERPDAGEVLFDGQRPAGRNLGERRVGFVFQHYALFRHMTVFENIAFGLRVRPRRERPSEAAIRVRVQALLELVQLPTLANRHPAQLSGGQRQRVALARALAVEPRVLLLDEPFGALDANVRQELRRWLRRLHDELRITSVFVTHDQEEALDVADRVVVMDHGRVLQVGTARDVYERPATAFVYRFLGPANEIGGQLVRPHDLEVVRDTADAWPGLPVTVAHVAVVGPVVRLELERCDATGEPIGLELSREMHDTLGLEPGERVRVRPRAARAAAPSDQPVALGASGRV